MSTANKIVSILLETDAQPDVNSEPDVNIEPDVDPERYLHQYADQLDKDAAAGNVTPQTAMTAQRFWHREATYSDGYRHYEVRRNGATQTWKRRPGEFRIPIKIGFRGYGKITHRDAAEWSTIPLPDKPRPKKVKKLKPKPVNPSSLMPPPL